MSVIRLIGDVVADGDMAVALRFEAPDGTLGDYVQDTDGSVVRVRSLEAAVRAAHAVDPEARVTLDAGAAMLLMLAMLRTPAPPIPFRDMERLIRTN